MAVLDHMQVMQQLPGPKQKKDAWLYQVPLRLKRLTLVDFLGGWVALQNYQNAKVSLY